MIVIPEVEYEQKPNKSTWPADNSTEREQKLYALSLRKSRKTDRTDRTAAKPDSANYFQTEVDRFPAAFRARGQRLLAALMRHYPAISWKTNGEVVFGAHGSPRSGSHIIDLIYHATAVKRRAEVPIGWNQFLETLKELNVPSTTLSAETLRDMNRATKPAVWETIR